MDRKKLLSIILGIVFLAAAGTIVVKTMSGDSQTDVALKGKTTLLKCKSQGCGAVFEISMQDYYDSVMKAPGTGVSGLTCKKCGKDMADRAVKCDKCSTVFYYSNDSVAGYADKCPNCGFSKSEDERKKGSQPQ